MVKEKHICKMGFLCCRLINRNAPPPDVNNSIIPRFIPPIKRGWVIKVYDGDTITVLEKLCDKWYKFNIRIRDIDCPELRSKVQEEKCVAMIARDFLSKRIMHTWVRLENNGNDKYGRLLADVYDAKGENMGNLMIKKRMAVAYDGGTKKVPESWSNYHKNRI